MRIIRSANPTFSVLAHCFVCEDAFLVEDPAYHAYDADGALLGPICQTCTLAHEQLIQQVLFGRAEDLRAQADQLEALSTQTVILEDGPNPHEMAERRAMRRASVADEDISF